jgi:hypothetical protein
MFIPDPDFFPSRIQNQGGGKKINQLSFFFGCKLFNFFNRYRKRFESMDTEFKYFKPKKLLLSSQKDELDPRSGKNFSRIQG